jgi:hypothetical protein
MARGPSRSSGTRKAHSSPSSSTSWSSRTANLDRKLTFTTEFSLEAEERAVNVGIETLEIGVNVVPAFQIVAGGFHLPLSPWAVTASQGAYRYLPVEIPEGLVEEEGKEFLPIDQVGVQARGAVPGLVR